MIAKPKISDAEKRSAQQRFDEMRAFVGPGERFHYLGREMVCVRVVLGNDSPLSMLIGGIVARYADDHGIVRDIRISHGELPALSKGSREVRS